MHTRGLGGFFLRVARAAAPTTHHPAPAPAHPQDSQRTLASSAPRMTTHHPRGRSHGRTRPSVPSAWRVLALCMSLVVSCKRDARPRHQVFSKVPHLGVTSRNARQAPPGQPSDRARKRPFPGWTSEKQTKYKISYKPNYPFVSFFGSYALAVLNKNHKRYKIQKKKNKPTHFKLDRDWFVCGIPSHPLLKKWACSPEFLYFVSFRLKSQRGKAKTPSKNRQNAIWACSLSCIFCPFREAIAEAPWNPDSEGLMARGNPGPFARLPRPRVLEVKSSEVGDHGAQHRATSQKPAINHQP